MSNFLNILLLYFYSGTVSAKTFVNWLIQSSRQPEFDHEL